MSNGPVSIQQRDSRVLFDRAGGGFPTWMGFDGPEGTEAVSRCDRPWLSVELPDGARAEPFWPVEYEPIIRAEGEATRVEFRNLPWRRPDGKVLDGFRLTQQYELWPDGVCFARSFFLSEDGSSELSRLRLMPATAIEAGNEISWGYWERPDVTNADIIQAIGGIKRFLRPGTDAAREGMLFPHVSLDFGHEGRRDKHLEWFLEGANSPGNDVRNTASAIRWKGQSPELEWDFLNKRTRSPRGIWQWRNQWGWTLCRAPRRRRHAPLRFYHWIGYTQRYPTDAQIVKMAREGADLLVLHESWRADLQNGGTPHDEKEFRRVIATAHDHGMRMAVYMRGNELSIREEQAEWFDEFFRKDYDGLYMDYGSPVGYSGCRDEVYPGGRIAFREHYMAMRAVRRRVGERGVFLSHTGPFFAACGMTGLMDGYTAGEGERGVLLSDRTAHAYFSGLSVAPPAMWTAAFPDYSTDRAIPFLASVGQTPHVSLGTQIETSSLQHPAEPGAVSFARPLWKLWGLLRGQENVLCLHTENTEGVFTPDSPNTAACLFILEDGSRLLLAANFVPEPRRLQVRVNWNAAGGAPAAGETVTQLNPHANPPTTAASALTECFEATAPAYGLAGWIVTARPAAWREAIKTFCEAYPTPDAADRAYREEIESLRKARFEPVPHQRLFVRFNVPPLPVTWEDSIWWDLYENWNELARLGPGGERQHLGFVSAKGLMRQKPERSDYLWPGVTTPWIALHDLLPAGRHDLALNTLHYGEPFYSFVRAEFTCDPDSGADRFSIRFANELDSDRSRLTFSIHLSR
jgi:hypothetical protein